MLFRGAVAAATFAVAIAATPESQTLKVRLYPMYGSAVRGTATIVQRGTDVLVNIDLVGTARGTAQFAHLHRGTCEHVAASTVYELQPIRNGRSTTRLTDVDIVVFTHRTYSILIHKTLSRGSAHVACGTISGA